MAVTVSQSWQFHGLDIIRIENEWLICDIVPALGGKVIHLVDKRADRQVLWSNPAVTPHEFALGENADDHYCGGWDDVFPTAAPSVSNYGDQLPSMGELRSTRLTAEVVESSAGQVVVHLSGRTPITPALWSKTITVLANEPMVHTTIRVENVGVRPFDFMLGSHLAVSPTATMRIDAPATRHQRCPLGRDQSPV